MAVATAIELLRAASALRGVFTKGEHSVHRSRLRLENSRIGRAWLSTSTGSFDYVSRAFSREKLRSG